MPKGILKEVGENELADRIREAIGADPDEVVHVTTPQFERLPGIPGPFPPPEPFQRVKELSYAELLTLGCRPWGRFSLHGSGQHLNYIEIEADDDSYPMLMLFPYEWYGSIPKGFPIFSISGEHESFEPGETDNDIRFGLLAYGVMVKAPVKK